MWRGSITTDKTQQSALCVLFFDEFDSIIGNGDGVLPANVDSLLSWMLAGLSNGKQLQSWIIAKE
jgi:SpoVK/Ycf46/Vps4 family AAA+-type ATPase